MSNENWRKCLICANSNEVIKKIPDASIDFILTDPPYNIGKHSTGNISLPGRTAINNDIAEWDWVDLNLEEWADEFIRVLKPTGNLFIFTSYNQIGRWYDCLDHKFDTSNFMVWHKTNPVPKIFKTGFLNSCEMIFTCWSKGHTWNFISQTEMHNFFESPICMKPERLSNPKHPAQKPVVLLKKLISIASNEGDIIFDPFMGVGSTGVAALDMNRKFIGVEIDKRYFDAAKQRIETMMEQNNQFENTIVCDPVTTDGTTAWSLPMDLITRSNQESKPKNMELEPIIKWAGGKEKELVHILPNVPKGIENFYEPFVGGGAVFMAMKADRYYVNDLSSELISLYRCIATQNAAFFDHVNDINKAWRRAKIFYRNNMVLKDYYLDFRNDVLSKKEFVARIALFCKERREEILDILGGGIEYQKSVLPAEIQKNLSRKMCRMKDLEMSKHLLPDGDIDNNIETAVKSALYMYYRTIYNDSAFLNVSGDELRTALFFFIRNYAYSGMFRYNDKGEFNVPYGGIAYNGKCMDKKLEYYRSQPLLYHFADTSIYNLDFEAFLEECLPKENDFVFLDPPYDSEFSTYAGNEFSRADQERLAHYMIHCCRAKWMLIIKYTDFIYKLYNHPGINIRSFDKKYLVSFMNRNDKAATHLLITNY